MNIFRKKPDDKNKQPAPPATTDPAQDPNMIRAYDQYGRELYLTRQQWRDSVLLGTLEKSKGNPEELYNLLLGALKDGFAVDVVPYAEHLYRTDPIPARAATILGIVYMDANRLDDAQRVFEQYLAAHGEDGYVLTNLAHVYDRRGDRGRAESTLWHALEVDPNQENGFNWYVTMQNERGGKPALLEAYRRIARLPTGWRAQLWLARDALETRNLPAAEAFYAEALARAGRPVPTDLLQQMSGDLGKNGYLEEITRLVTPHFDPAYHGLPVGNNLIKANFDLGRLEAARAIVNQLYAMQRPDWKETLSYWDTELAKAGLAKQPEAQPEKVELALFSVEGPLWARASSPFAPLLPAKQADAPIIAVFGSTALLANAPAKPEAQLADRPGRLSRSIPLLLAEKIHLRTNAVGVALVPWAQGKGLALFGSEYDDRTLCSLPFDAGRALECVVGVTIDTTRSPWRIMFRVLKRADASRIIEAQAEAPEQNPGPAVEELTETLIRRLAEIKIVSTTPAPEWYQLPRGTDLTDYLLRLEQELSVTAIHQEFLRGGGLFGERDIVGGTLQLCVSYPTNPLVRMVLAQTLREMQAVRPEIVREYRDKVALLQREHPIGGEVGGLIGKAIGELVQ